MVQKTTIYDIAKAVGVSSTTISRYLNGHYGSMSTETKQLIARKIEELEYFPDSRARGLKSKQSGLVGIVVNHINHQLASQLARGINKVCSENGFVTMLFSSDNDLEKEKEQIRLCQSYHADAMALIPVNTDCSFYHKVHEGGLPIVMCMRYRTEWNYGGVYIDNVQITRRALEQVYENGYHKICFITDEINLESNKHYRERAFVEFATERMQVDGYELLYQVGDDISRIESSIREMFKKYPNERKAVFTVNTNMLYLTLKVIKSMNLRIPEDIGILGYDLLGWSEVVSPGITCLTQPSYRAGVLIGEQLVKLIKKPGSLESRETWLNGNIIFRDSTKKF